MINSFAYHIWISLRSSGVQIRDPKLDNNTRKRVYLEKQELPKFVLNCLLE